MPVYKDEQRGTWYFKCNYRDWQGEIKTKMRRGFATKKEAQQGEREFLDMQSGNMNMKLVAFVEVYFNDKGTRLKERSIMTKRILFETKMDKRYKALSVIEKENKIWEMADGTREYISIEIMKYPFAVSCEGKYYKRSGATLHELNGFELQNFLLERAGKTWDAVPVPGVKASDLSKDALEAFRKKAVKSNRMTENEVSVSDELLLRNLKLFDGDYLTRAAILLFHPTPEQYVTGAYIKIGYFALVGAFGEDAELIEDLQYQDVIEGPLILQVDKAIDLIFTKYFKALVDYEGVQRTETNMLTRGIVRELLLNAINHKEYATGVPIQVSIYDDKIEIFNMGSWSKRVPTDERVYEKHESVPNNPKIADVSFRSGDVESWGRDFLKIKAECNKISAPLPVIDAKNDGVSITATGCEKYMSLLRYGQYGQVGVDGVWREKEAQNDKCGDEMKEDVNLIQKNERSLKEVLRGVLNQKDCEKTLPIIEYLETKSSITTQTAKQILGKSSATAWRYLQILVKADVLEADGNTNNAEYVVKDIYR